MTGMKAQLKEKIRLDVKKNRKLEEIRDYLALYFPPPLEVFDSRCFPPLPSFYKF
jgi:hypothetical protein